MKLLQCGEEWLHEVDYTLDESGIFAVAGDLVDDGAADDDSVSVGGYEFHLLGV